jgi:hypothetical protein
MAEPTPWQSAGRKKPTYVKKIVAQYDVYNFSHVTTSNGTNPPLRIPCDGPNAAGAPPPSSSPQIETIIVTSQGTDAPVYGSNFARPSV